MFCKKSCSKKFRNIHKKTPVLESLFNKVAGLKRDSNTGVSCECFEIFRKHPRIASSIYWLGIGITFKKIPCYMRGSYYSVQVIYCFYVVLWFKWSLKKHCVAKGLLAIWEIILHENNRNYNSYKFSYKFPFTFILSFLTNQKQEPGFQLIGGLVQEIFVFCYNESRSTSNACRIQ